VQGGHGTSTTHPQGWRRSEGKRKEENIWKKEGYFLKGENCGVAKRREGKGNLGLGGGYLNKSLTTTKELEAHALSCVEEKLHSIGNWREEFKSWTWERIDVRSSERGKGAYSATQVVRREGRGGNTFTI